MTNLTIINQNGQLLAESRQIAEMVDKEHKDLLRDIRGYVEILGKSNFALSNFFIESTYLSEQNKTLPCYLITKKGCDMVANKMTGEKGVLFTATYVTRFEEMEQQINKPMSQLEILAQAAQALVEQDKAIKQLAATQTKQAEELQGIRNIVSLSPNAWRKDTASLIGKMARNLGGGEHIQDLRSESYKMLDERFGVSLKTRLNNKRKNMSLEGVSKSKIASLNYLDVIAEDKKLIEGYTAIIKEMAIKHGVSS